MKYLTYILYSEKFDAFYYGQTQDLEARLVKHNSGFVKSSARYLPWCIFAYKELATRSEAFLMEKKLKNCKNRNRIKKIIVQYQFIDWKTKQVIGPEN